MQRYQELGIDKLSFDTVIKVTLKNGKVFTGDYDNWTSALDNEPDGESIGLMIDDVGYELFLDEIEAVETE
jgi:hypothetical protein